MTGADAEVFEIIFNQFLVKDLFKIDEFFLAWAPAIDNFSDYNYSYAI